MASIYKPNSIQVHPGIFHADDVTCCVQALILNERVQIVREDTDSDSDLDNGKIVADVGYGMFDHHQKDTKIREDGFKHCASSLLWEFWGKDVIKSLMKDYLGDDIINEAWSIINDKFMMTLSIVDNGLPRDEQIKLDAVALGVSTTVGLYNPTYLESDNNSEVYNEYFFECVENIKKVFERYIINIVDDVIAKKIVLEVMQNRDSKHVLVLNSYASWTEAVCTDKDIYCVVYPSMRGGWNVQLAPESVGSYATLIDVPDWWKGYKYVGKNDRPISGMTFCHATGFLSVFDSKDHAVRAAEYLAELADLDKCSNE